MNIYNIHEAAKLLRCSPRKICDKARKAGRGWVAIEDYLLNSDNQSCDNATNKETTVCLSTSGAARIGVIFVPPATSALKNRCEQVKKS